MIVWSSLIFMVIFLFWVLLCGYTFVQNTYACQWSAYHTRVILTCSGSNAPFSHMKGRPHGGTHAWGPPLMWEEGALLPEHLSFFHHTYPVTVFLWHLNVPALFLKCTEKDGVSLPIVDDTSQVIQNNMMVQMWPSKIRSPFPLHVCSPQWMLLHCSMA